MFRGCCYVHIVDDLCLCVFSGTNTIIWLNETFFFIEKQFSSGRLFICKIVVNLFTLEFLFEM